MRRPTSTMFFALGLICIAVGVRFTSTRPEVVFDLGPIGVTYFHIMFFAGFVCIIRGVWKWVTD